MALDRDKVLQTAQKLVEKKRYDKAIAEYQRLVADDPKDVRTLLKIGDLYLRMEQYVEAITTYERVGQFYSAQGFALKAIAVYKQIRETVNRHVPHLEGRFGHVVTRLAELYTQLGLTSDALATYDEVATRLLKAGRELDAIDIFKKIVDLDPNNPLPYLRLAEAYVRVKNVEGAIQRFGAAAEILLRLGRRDDALKVVERLLQHRTDARFARMAAEIYLDRGEGNDGMSALAKLQICFKENPKDLDTLALLARAFDLLGQPAKAVEVQKEAARIARETNREAFRQIVDALLARAPHDEGVRQLAAMRSVAAAPSAPASGASEPRSSSIDVEISVSEAVSVEEYAEVVASAAPFALQQPPPQPALAAAVDPAVRAKQILVDAETLRHARAFDRAAHVLAAGVHELPDARELREKLCDVLIEAGDQAGAVEHMLAFADHLAASGDVAGAARVLDEVLLLEPGQAHAVQMLASLGYTLPGDGYEVDEPGYGYGEYGAAADPGYDPSAPLPSYDLEEIGAEQAMGRLPGRGAGQGSASAQLDEPFASEQPLPAFPIDDGPTELAVSPPAAAAKGTSLPHPGAPPPAYAASQPVASHDPAAHAAPVAMYDPTGQAAPHAAAYDAGQVPPPAFEAPAPASQFDEDALDEVEFFAAHGMFDEAFGILDEQLQRLPNHPLLLERRRELEAMAAAAAADAGQSGARPMSRAEPDTAEDRAFDIAASLDALDALDQEAVSRAAVADDPRQVSVESVFEQFKAGVAAHVSESDAATHYDLGVAYREMGLLPDAISEFQLAARDPGRECVCQSMIGMIHLQLGNLDAAIDAFIRGLHAPQRTIEQELALIYEIGNAYDMRRSPEQALYYFQRIARVDPRYADPRGSVTERIRRLETGAKPQARAVGAENLGADFDSAFDDLLDDGKLP